MFGFVLAACDRLRDTRARVAAIRVTSEITRRGGGVAAPRSVPSEVPDENPSATFGLGFLLASDQSFLRCPVCATGRSQVMNERERFRQPKDVSQSVSDYLEMTSPQRRRPKQKPRRRDDRKDSPRRGIDNRGLSLDEGNDFA